MSSNSRTIVKMILLVYICVLITISEAKDASVINFVKSYIENERRPIHLILANNCWKRDEKLKLASELAKSGVRTSGSIGPISSSKYQHQQLLFLLDLDCLDSEEIVRKATSNSYLGYPYSWLAISPSHSGNEDQNSSFIWEAPLLADSDFVLATRNGHGFQLVELHKPSPSGPTVSTPRGYYNGTLVDIRPHRELFRRRRDVMGHPLTMSNVLQDSNSTMYHLPKEDRLEPQFDSIAKVCWSNVKIAFEMLNATPRYIYSYRWGYMHNGQWSGMIDDLYSGRADLGTNCMVRANRLPVVVYTDVLAPYRVAFVFRQPPLSYVSNIFSLPFSARVWVALAASSALATAALYVTSRHEAGFGRSTLQLDGSIGDALLLTMSAISQQGSAYEPRRPAGRILVLVLFSTLMALYAAYSANIVVLLQAPSNSIKTLTQLAHSKITLAANDVDYNHFVFRGERDPVRREIFKRIEPDKGKHQFYDLEDGVERIRQGFFAFHSIVEPLYRQIEKTYLEMEKCDLMEVDFMNDFDGHVPVKKDSPYLELLRVVFKQIRESGIKAVLARRFQVPRPRCMDKASAFNSVGLLDLRPVLVLMLYGIGTSILILAAEIATFKLCRRMKKRRALLESRLFQDSCTPSNLRESIT